jgi:hypothetical protein
MILGVRHSLDGSNLTRGVSIRSRCRTHPPYSQGMTDFLYRVDGRPASFVRGRFIHDLRGNPINQISSSGRVHRLTGQYVGELYDHQVVDKNFGDFGNIGSRGNPGNAGSRGNPGNRGHRGCPYRDVFDSLT